MPKILRVGLTSPVEPIDPWGAQDLTSAMIQAQIFETPYAPQEGGGPPIPWLMDGPLEPEGHGRYSAAVREGIRFSDGTPLTAEHLARSLTRNPAFQSQASAEAVPGERVIFHPKGAQKGRFETFLTQLHAKVAIERGGKPLGTGPFQVAPDATPERFRLLANPEYRHSNGLDELVFVAIPPTEDGDLGPLIEALNEGDIDFTGELSREDLARVMNRRKWLEPGSGTALLYFNTERPALADAAVRRAIAQAIDRSALTKISYPNPLAFTATALLPPILGNARDGITPDPKVAARTLEQRGGAPSPLELLVVWTPRTYLPHPLPVAEALRDQLRAVGIEVSLSPTRSREDYFRRVARGDFDLALTGWTADSMDPADYVESLLASRSIPAGNEPGVLDGNLGRLRSEEMDRALERYRSERSQAARDEVLRLAVQEMAVLPLMYGPTIFAYTFDVRKFKPSALGIPHFAEVELAEAL